MTMNFDPNQKEKKNKEKDVTGIMNMKFMKSAEQAKKTKTKEQARMLIDQIQNEAVSSDEDEAPATSNKKQSAGLFNSSSKFAASGTAPELDQAKVLETAKALFLQQQQNKAQVDTQNQMNDAESESESDDGSEEDMSFTSDEDNTDALNILALCADVEKRKRAAAEAPARESV